MVFHIEKEISEQPDVINRLLTDSGEIARKIAKAIRDFDPVFVMIAGRGTSDNAGRYAEYLMGIHAGLPVALASPSIHTLYEAPPRLARALVIGISQSGKAEDVRRVISDAREQGALTVTITNNEESPLARSAAYHLPLLAGEEISVAATKTYTAQLAAIAMIVTELVDDSAMREELMKAPGWLKETLKFSDRIETWAQRYRYMDKFAAIGRSYNFCSAFEISLKIKELCYITGVEYSEADFRHGPIALIQPGFPVIVIAPTGKAFSTVSDLLEQLRNRKAECIVISNDEGALAGGQNAARLPSGVPEWLSPLAAVIPGQVFAMKLALAKGHTVDKPIGLTKVTVTT